jgi:transcription initiation factor IIE alpha subunit
MSIGYILIPEPIASDPNIKNGAKILYGHVLKLDGINNGCYVQNEYLAEKLGVKERQIRRYIVQLRKSKYITAIRRRDSQKRFTSRRLVPLYKMDKKDREKK